MAAKVTKRIQKGLNYMIVNSMENEFIRKKNIIAKYQVLKPL
jgi:hypothetical protein